MSRIIYKPLRKSLSAATPAAGELFISSGNRISYMNGSQNIDLSENAYIKARVGGVLNSVYNRNGAMKTNLATRLLTGLSDPSTYDTARVAHITDRSYFPELANTTGVLQFRGNMHFSNLCDEIFPIDHDRAYRMSLTARTKSIDSGVNSCYFGMQMYDADFQQMSSFMNMYHPGTTNYLAQDLKPGDTKVYLTESIANWVASTAGGKGISFYDYVSSSGRKYEDYFYTRVYYTSLWTSNVRAEIFNDAEMSINLAAPWSGPTMVAGRRVAQVTAGGTYDYGLGTWTHLPNDWTHMETVRGMYGSLPDPAAGFGGGNMLYFPKHAVYAVPYGLISWTNSGSNPVTQVTDVTFEELPYTRVANKNYLPENGGNLLNGVAHYNNSVSDMIFNVSSGKMMVFTGSASGFRGWVNVDGSAITT